MDLNGKKRIIATVLSIGLLILNQKFELGLDQSIVNGVVALVIGLVVGDSIRPTLRQ